MNLSGRNLFVLELRGIAITSLYIAMALGIRIGSALRRRYGYGTANGLGKG